MTSIVVRMPKTDVHEINKIMNALNIKWGAAYQIWRNKDKIQIKWENL